WFFCQAEDGIRGRNVTGVQTCALPISSVENIFAIGDIVAGPSLAHKASYEAKVAAEAISGEKSAVDYLGIPAVCFTEPELATVGDRKSVVEGKRRVGEGAEGSEGRW